MDVPNTPNRSLAVDAPPRLGRRSTSGRLDILGNSPIPRPPALVLSTTPDGSPTLGHSLRHTHRGHDPAHPAAALIQADDEHLRIVPEIVLQSMPNRNLEALLERIAAERDERIVEDDPPPPYIKSETGSPMTGPAVVGDAMSSQEVRRRSRLLRQPRLFRDTLQLEQVHSPLQTAWIQQAQLQAQSRPLPTPPGGIVQASQAALPMTGAEQHPLVQQVQPRLGQVRPMFPPALHIGQLTRAISDIQLREQTRGRHQSSSRNQRLEADLNLLRAGEGARHTARRLEIRSQNNLRDGSRPPQLEQPHHRTSVPIRGVNPNGNSPFWLGGTRPSESLAPFSTRLQSTADLSTQQRTSTMEQVYITQRASTTQQHSARLARAPSRIPRPSRTIFR